MKRFILLTFAAATIIASAGLLNLDPANAVTAADWKAGRIIDDSVFTSPNEMSVADIQNFLNNLVPNCDTNGTQPASEYGRPDLTHAQYAAMRGWPGPPYVCLKNYYEVPKYEPGDYIPANNFSGSIPAGAVSAAQIIHDAARLNSLNPKAILVKIATESAGPLTADTWPVQSQYTYAMGSHCPDSGPGGSANCDRNYAGFSMQVASGAGLLRWYIDNMQQGWWSYKKPYQTNSILWNVAGTGCGAGDVYIESKATAALYTYTPYQPNQAALNNMYGPGNGCSAYGNRNFWRVWNDWFGSGHIPAYHWQPTQQGVYTNDTLTTPASVELVAGNSRRQYVSIRVLNDGTATWNKGAIFLGTSNPPDRASSLYDSTWVSRNRPATITEPSVAPGNYATFSFWVNTPTSSGLHKEYFNLVAEGLTWMNDMGLYIPFNVQPAQYRWSVIQQEAYYDADLQKKANLLNTGKGTRLYMYLKVQNTGNTTWDKSNLHLATTGPVDRNSDMYDSTWLGPNRPAGMRETSVAPGEYATLGFWINASKTGVYKEYFNLVADGVSWFTDIGCYYPITVNNPSYSWQNSAQTAYTDASMASLVDLNNVTPNQRIYLYMSILNTGNVPWYRGSLNLATNNPRDRASILKDTAWLSSNRLATVTEAVVAPGESATLGVYVLSPSSPGTYKEYLNYVYEGRNWLNDIGLYYPFTVKN